MKYFIYYKTGQHEASGTEYKLLKQALRQYADENQLSVFVDSLCVSKTSKGKPYIAGADFHFSISHTDGLWACAVGTAPCGLDIQIFGRHRENAIAKKLFEDADAEYVKNKGTEGFYQIWSRFEAVVKYSGEGLFSGKPVLSDGSRIFDIVETGLTKGAGLNKGTAGTGKVYLREFSAEDFDVKQRLAGALCTEEHAEVSIRRLNG